MTLESTQGKLSKQNSTNPAGLWMNRTVLIHGFGPENAGRAERLRALQGRVLIFDLVSEFQMWVLFG